MSRYRQGQAVVVCVAKPQSVAYAALLLYRWLAAGASAERNGSSGSRTGLVVSGCLVGGNLVELYKTCVEQCLLQ